MKPLEIKAAIQISKPAAEVYEAIVDPGQMSHYFIQTGSGRLEETKEVVWRFPEFDMDCPVRVKRTEPGKRIVFGWDGEAGELLVDITLTPVAGTEATVVRITEGSMDNNEAGLAWLVGNTEGWANFLACLKAYLEFGINLRTGAFDFMRT